jgi:hypothetical protein
MKTAALLLLLVTACAVRSAVTGPYHVDRDGRRECEDHCRTLDLAFAGVVIVANQLGCICEVAPDTSAALEGAAVAAAANIAEREEQSSVAQNVPGAGASSPGR